MVKKINFDKSIEGWIAGTINGKWGFVNSVTSELIPAIYDNVYKFDNGFARVVIDNKVGIIRQDGSYLIEPTLDAIWPFHKGIAKVNFGGRLINGKFFGGKYGYIKDDGTYLTQVIFDRGNEFKSDFVKLTNGGTLNEDGSYNSGGKDGKLDIKGKLTWSN
jgi:WG containing repeat